MNKMVADNFTWIYRSVIGALFAVTLGLIRFEAGTIMAGQDQIRGDIQSLKTDNAVNQVTIMTMQTAIGEESGRQQVQAERTGKVIDTMNIMRDRLTVIETQFKDHLEHARN